MACWSRESCWGAGPRLGFNSQHGKREDARRDKEVMSKIPEISGTPSAVEDKVQLVQEDGFPKSTTDEPSWQSFWLGNQPQMMGWLVLTRTSVTAQHDCEVQAVIPIMACCIFWCVMFPTDLESCHRSMTLGCTQSHANQFLLRLIQNDIQ